jgi:hypothetical protein
MSKITVNASELDIIRSREALASFAGVLDAKRPSWYASGAVLLSELLEKIPAAKGHIDQHRCLVPGAGPETAARMAWESAQRGAAKLYGQNARVTVPEVVKLREAYPGGAIDSALTLLSANIQRRTGRKVLNFQLVFSGLKVPGGDGRRTHPTGLHQDWRRDTADSRWVQHMPLASAADAPSAFVIGVKPASRDEPPVQPLLVSTGCGDDRGAWSASAVGSGHAAGLRWLHGTALITWSPEALVAPEP